MSEKDILLDVRDLAFSFHTYAGEVQAVRGVSFKIERGKCLGIVGESGCGKSVTAKSLIGLNPGKPVGELKQGEILFDGKDLAKISEKEMRKVRAQEIRMIFQDPMTCLNPTMTIGRQILEGICKYGDKCKEEAKKITLETLTLAGISSPEERFKQYPHELSGGMRQRVMIALAMAVNPKLLIADEPTTALDVTIQAQILELIKDIQKHYDTSIIMITHDLGVVANIADEIAVMYAGKILEYGQVEDIFEFPAHPYTWGVLQSIPPEDMTDRQPLSPILGTPPDLIRPPKACPFAARCPYTMKICSAQQPPVYSCNGTDHRVACWLYHPKAMPVKNPFTGQEVMKHE
ncbi:ABC transporter ATP-binding protein [Clostridiales bacterium COT073_COT-073]|nr:ABC transporter ATP-binding protein [Clostridiales bacterium COT073_COT-073]